MCLLILVAGVHPDLPLLVGANRDEWLDRPAEPMTLHRRAAPRVLGGRDHRAGGTWLAVNDRGVVAALTNAPPGEAGRDSSRRTRGELPIALASHPDARTAAQVLAATVRPADYNPAWLVVADREERFTIDLTGDRPVMRPLAPGVHVVENHAPGTDTPKVRWITELLGDLTTLAPDVLLARLRRTLADHHLPQPADGRAESGSGARNGEDALATAVRAACVHATGYGTRWSAVVAVGRDPTTPPALTYRDGPACRGPDVDAGPWWSR